MSERNDNDLKRYDRIAEYAKRVVAEHQICDDSLRETHLEDKIKHCARILSKLTARSIDRAEGKYPDYGTLLQIEDRPELWADRISDELDRRDLERRRRGGPLLG